MNINNIPGPKGLSTGTEWNYTNDLIIVWFIFWLLFNYNKYFALIKMYKFVNKPGLWMIDLIELNDSKYVELNFT